MADVGRTRQRAMPRLPGFLIALIGLGAASGLLLAPNWSAKSLSVWHWVMVGLIALEVSIGVLMLAWSAPDASPMVRNLRADRRFGAGLAASGLVILIVFALADVLGFGDRRFGTNQAVGVAMGASLVIIGLAVQAAASAQLRPRLPDARIADLQPGARPIRVNRSLVAAGVWVIAVCLLVLAGLVYGRRGVITPVLTALLFIVPGDLLRRAAHLNWPRSAAGVAAADIALSMGVLVVVGSPLVAFGIFRPAPLSLTLGTLVISLALVAMSRSKRDDASPGQDLITTALALGGALAIAGFALLMLEARPIVADKVSLGQFETAVAVAEEGEVPDSAMTFGTETDFPVHYLFYDLALGSVLSLGGFDLYQERLQFHASLRVIAMALFVLGWFLAGRAFLRAVLGRSVAGGIAVLLPPVLLLSPVITSKFHEVLTEGWALALTGIGIWALLTATDGARRDRRSALVIGAVALGLIVGISLPSLAAATILVGSWVVITTEVRWRRRTHRGVGLFISSGWLVAIGPVVGIALFNWIGRGSLTSLFRGSIDSAETFPGQAFQALLFLSADSLSDANPQDVLARNLTPEQLFTSGAGWVVVGAAGLAALLGVGLMRRRPWRQLAWLLASVLLTVGYAAFGVAFGETDVTPWNTIARNGFYAWVPAALFVLLGLAFAWGWVSRWYALRAWARPTRTWALWGLGGMVLLSAAGGWIPTGVTMANHVAESGWIRGPQMTEDGHAALRWISTSLPSDARIISSEVTYGSQMIAERTLLTDGKGTLENAEVTGAAINVLSGTTDFFLVARDPRVLIELDVDYVLARADGAYRIPQFGGVALMRSLYRQTRAAEPPPLVDLPYLEEAKQWGEVTLYEVNPARIPEIQDDGFVDDRAELPPCEQELCLAYVPAPAEGCAIEELSSVRGRCIVTRHGATATP